MLCHSVFRCYIIWLLYMKYHTTERSRVIKTVLAAAFFSVDNYWLLACFLKGSTRELVKKMFSIVVIDFYVVVLSVGSFYLFL